MTESNAFLKSMKLKYNDDCHSIDCSMIFLNMKICPVVPLPGQKPACSFLSFDSTLVGILSITIVPMTLLTTDSSVIPRQFLHFFLLLLLNTKQITETLSIPGLKEKKWSATSLIRIHYRAIYTTKPSDTWV